jgi:hypothetical protein
MKKRVYAFIVVIALLLAAVVPVSAHPVNPNTLPVPALTFACPACVFPGPCVFVPNSLVEVQQLDVPCPVTPGCIVHKHIYQAMYKCPRCGRLFRVTLEYTFKHSLAPKCPGGIGWSFVCYGP